MKLLKRLVGMPTDGYTPKLQYTGRNIRFTDKAYKSMRGWNLSEKDIRDVVFHGGTVDAARPYMMVKKYHGYEIGVFFYRDKYTNGFVVTWVWKRGRY